jgi:DNA mismatch repair protein MutS2
MLEQARQQLKSDTLTKQALDSIERLVSDAAAPIALEGNVTRAFRPGVASPVLNPETITPGMRVYLPHLKTEAEVLSKPEKNQLRVSVSGLKMTVPLPQVSLERAPAATGVKPAPGANKAAKASGKFGGKQKGKGSILDDSESSYQPVRTSSNVCDLRGVRVEAGLEKVDEFLDQMLRLHERAVFILHGHGTGAMREAVRSHLSSVRHVERFHAAPPDDGGDALTVVWFRD